MAKEIKNRQVIAPIAQKFREKLKKETPKKKRKRKKPSKWSLQNHNQSPLDSLPLKSGTGL